MSGEGSLYLLTVGESVNWYKHHEVSVEVSQKAKNSITREPSCIIPGYIPTIPHILLQRYLLADVCCSSLNTQDRESGRSPSASRWIKKMWHIYRMELYSVIGKI